MSELKVGDVFECKYPFHQSDALVDSPFGESVDPNWYIGCQKTLEEYGTGYGETFLNAHGVGKIIFEVLAVVDMPRKYKNRVIYKFDTIDPDGVRVNRAKDYTVSVDKFNQMIECPYPHDYEVIDE